MILLLICVLAGATLVGGWAAWVGLKTRDPVAYVLGVMIVTLSIIAASAIAIDSVDSDTLECETLVETMVTVGDVEVCVPTPDAIDFLEVYQS